MSIVDNATSVSQSLRIDEEKALLLAAESLLKMTKDQYAERINRLEAIGNVELRIHDRSIEGYPPYIRQAKKCGLNIKAILDSYHNRRR